MNAITDGFTNFIAALGGANPKTAANTYTVQCSQVDLENAYRASTWFGKIVDIPADDATREWRAWQAENEQIELLESEEKRLQVRQKVRQALIWARLYGGSVIIPGGLPGNPQTPLRLDSIQQNAIEFLTVLDMHQISPHGLINDPLDKWFGHPEYYVINGGTGDATHIHPSRVIRFIGRSVPQRHSGNNGWGDSIWLTLRDAVTNADLGASVLGALLVEAKTDIVRIPEFMAMLGTAETENTLIRRFQMAQTLKSVSNVLILDKEDEWDQRQITWTGLPDVVEQLLTIMAGAADIPVTRLIGTSAKGLNATGEGDLRNYYDSVKAKQELIIEPEISPFDEMLIRSALGNRPDEVWYSWRPLYQQSEKEASENDKRDAETAQIYANSGLVPTEALETGVQNRMIESGRWPGLETALDEANTEVSEQPDPLTGDAAPRTLYVRRNVLNAAEIIEHFKAQGFETVTTADDMHVTVTFSRDPVDWLAMGDNWSGDGQGNVTIQPGGPRLMDVFGDAKVLLFASSELSWRHENMRRLGASWDFSDYQPHITISYGDMPDNVEPWRGEIVLGPEIFEEIDPDWSASEA